MYRELKFRAWDESKKIMIYQGSAGLETIQKFMIYYGNKILMQYTGLKDYEGKEIFDKDIVQCEFIHASWWWHGKKTERDGYAGSVGICLVDNLGCATKIVFPKKDFWFEKYKDLEEKINKYCLNEKITINSHCKVLGNIYENPELLTKID